MTASSNELRELILDLEKFPVELRFQLRPALLRAAAPILADAKDRASWSDRIPSAIRLQMSFAARSAGVLLRVDRKAAPHARAFEDASQRNNGWVRHPVFGDREHWVQQRTRPFLFPAVQAGASAVMAESNAAVIDAARAAGFR